MGCRHHLFSQIMRFLIYGDDLQSSPSKICFHEGVCPGKRKAVHLNMGNTWVCRRGCQRTSNPEVANGEQKTMLKPRTRSNSCSNQDVPQESDLQSCEEEANRDLIQKKQDGNISEDSDKLSQGMFQRKTSKSTGPSANAEESQKKNTAMINLTRREKEKYIPSDEPSSASAADDQKEKPMLETKKERAHSGHGKAAQAHQLKASPISPDSHKNCEVKLSASSSSSAKESSVDNEEDMYRDAEEIEREKTLPVCETGSSENKLSVAPEMDIIEYCRKEWRGNTPVAKRMKKGYEAVSQKFTSIRRVRGDNYCALRATLFQALSQTSELPDWLRSEDLTLLPEKLLSKYDWIQEWQLRQKLDRKMGELSDEIKDYLILLRKKWESMSEMKSPVERQAACDELFTNEEEEYSLYEAVKFLMLKTAIELYDDKKGKKVPVFSWLLFARDTSSNPSQLMNNHLNQIGHTGGLEQVEMFLLAYALQHTIRVYRLYKYSTDEFITLYPNDPEEDWPVVTLITEDDRHYNIPVRMCEETSL
ncbi:ubiquitin thioesterase otulin isoform X1 [Chelonoidis abingdonii]|uniref:ubiquitin thioesterase otulin isoform X1 n=1 Tax=Chelonoidis abingdonii TaxID=106734 RepID=UPI0013F26A8F|nr:ubiquitin thioesterase otulin isoform X1 [Chelonoidis abingdonii]